MINPKNLINRLLASSLIIGACSFSAFSQTTVQNGPWHDSATWGGLTPPTSASGLITINHSVTVDAPTYSTLTPLLVDQLTVGASGVLTIGAGAAMRLNNGTGVDVTVQASGLFTVSNGATLLINNAVTSSTSAVNTVFQSGAVLRTGAPSLPIATGLDQIDIYIEDVVSRNLVLNSTWSQLGANTNLFVNCPDLGTGIINLGGFITSLKKLEISDTDGSSGGRVVVLNGLGTTTLSIGTGGLTVQGDSRFFMTTTGSVTLNIASDFIFNSSSTLFSQGATSGTAILNFNGGDFIMNTGEWRLLAGGTDGDSNFNFTGAGSDMLVSGGLLSENGGGIAQATFTFSNSGSNQTLLWEPSAVGVGTMNLVINKSSSNLQLTSNLTVSGATLTSGTLVTNGNDLTFSGALSVTSGQIDATTTVPSPTSLSITGTGALPAAVPFVLGSVLSDLTLNRSGASLALTNASMENQGLVTVTAGSISEPLAALGVYDLWYNNPAALVSGNEIPASASVLRNLTKSGNGSVTLSSSPVINGDLTMSDGSILAGSQAVSVSGNFINDAPFTQSAGTSFTFLTNAPHTWSGVSTATVGALAVNGTLSISNVTTTILGDLTIPATASFQATSGTVAFNGTCSISDTGSLLQFNNLNIVGGGSLTAPNGAFYIAGNVSGNGAFVSNGSTVIFNGSTILSGSVKTFHNLTVDNLASLSGAVGFTMLSDLVNNGTISFTSGTLTWNSDGTFSGSGPVTLGRIIVSPARTLNLTLNEDLYLLTDLTISGSFIHSTTRSVIIGDDMTVSGNLSSVGTFVFTGATGLMAGAGLKNFKNMEVSGTLAVGNNVSYSLNDGLLTVTGVMSTTNGNGTLTTNGATTIVSTGISTTINSLLNNGTLDADVDFTLLRNFTNNGTFNAGSGTLSFSGSVTQSIQGSSVTTFNNINVTNTAAFVNVQSNQNLQGVLTLGPLARFDADGTSSTAVFTLLSTNSDPVRDGSIAEIPSDAIVNGNVTVQRFMQNSGKVNRYISSPVANMGVGQLDFTKESNSIRYYDETIGGTNASGYKALSPSGVFETGRGYLAYMYDEIDITWDATGVVHQGQYSLPVSYTISAGGPANDGWNLVGNPYPSGIVWESGSGWSLTNIDPIISVPDLNLGTGYPNYYHTSNLNDNSGDLPNDFIAMGQSFWVHANAPDPIMIVNESAKNPTLGGSFYRKAVKTSEQLIISLNNGKFQDRAFLKINEEATDDFDARLDGYKLKNEEMTLYLLDDAQRNLVMHTLPAITESQTIALGIEVAREGDYEITFSNTEAFSAGKELFLVDKYEGKSVPVASGEGYGFSIHEQGKVITDRFYLSRMALLSAERNMADWVQTYPNPVKDELTISVPGGIPAEVQLMDATGSTVWSDQVNGEGRIDFRNYPSGLFLLKISNGAEVLTRKIVK